MNIKKDYKNYKLSNRLNKTLTISLLIIILLGLGIFLTKNNLTLAGTLNNESEPTSTLYTLSDIYTRLTTNATATEGNHDLAPSANPDDSGYSLTDIYEAIPTIDASKVLTGTSYLGVDGNLEASSYAFPVTGQVISCLSNDDGDLQTGAVLSYTDNGDGTVTDNNTGLMWASDGDGAGCNNGASATWNSAIDYCANLTFAGYSDWYLPNIKELISIVKYETSPTIDQTYFPNTKSGDYKSSTTLITNTGTALGIHFSGGNMSTNTKTGSSYLRCVRGQ